MWVDMIWMDAVVTYLKLLSLGETEVKNQNFRTAGDQAKSHIHVYSGTATLTYFIQNYLHFQEHTSIDTHSIGPEVWIIELKI
jgi:hypothetical protein